jgi:hypothetical protein
MRIVLAMYVAAVFVCAPLVCRALDVGAPPVNSANDARIVAVRGQAKRIYCSAAAETKMLLDYGYSLRHVTFDGQGKIVGNTLITKDKCASHNSRSIGRL